MATRPRLDGQRVRDSLASEARAFLARYDQFAQLLPAADTAGAAHRGEDGRFVEALVRAFLRQVLPKSLAVATGFVLRPAVKTGTRGRERAGESDQASPQLDVIVHDAAHYPVFHDLEGTVIVPPEAVVGIISVKKNLRGRDIEDECSALATAARLCATQNAEGTAIIRGPFLAIVAATCLIDLANTPTEDWLFNKLRETYDTNPLPDFEDTVGYVGTFDRGGLFKARPHRRHGAVRDAAYVWFQHRAGEEHLPLQFVLTGLLSVFYDSSRNFRRRPGFSAFESGRPHDRWLGRIAVVGNRSGA